MSIPTASRAIVAALALMAGGCAASASPSQSERIVPVGGDLAEIVFALGLGASVVATDLSATYPPEADALPEIGYQRALTAEPIAAFSPTLVLATDLAGPPEAIEQLRDLGIEVVVIPRDRTIAGPAKKIRAVADALGVSARGAALAAQVDDDIAAASARVTPAMERPRVATLYLRGESVQLLFGEGSGIDAVVAAAGGIDVGTELGVRDHAPVGVETIVAGAPDVIVVTTSGLESVGGLDGLWRIPGLLQTPAGRARRVIVHEDQFLLGGGPRTGQLVSTLVDQLHPPDTSEETP